MQDALARFVLRHTPEGKALPRSADNKKGGGVGMHKASGLNAASLPRESFDQWFKREVLSHEASLVRYLSRLWPRRDEIADIRQETYVRVYEAALHVRPQAPKAFLFTTARHLIVDRLRHERVVRIQAAGDGEYLNALVEEISPERRVNAHQELVRLARAFDRLPPKCREVVWLRRVKGLSQKQVAAHLNIAEKTVEKHLRTGARFLARFTREATLMPLTDYAEDAEHEEGGQRHGPHRRN